MKVFHAVVILASCLLASGSPIIKVKSRLNEFVTDLIGLEINGRPKDYRKNLAVLISPLAVKGQKKSYCCYGVVRPFDMMAKAKQGLRALNQVGYSLKQVRQALGIQQKTLEGKLEKAEKKAEDISARVEKALKETMKILTDATKAAAAKLGSVSDATNDLGQLSKDIEETKSHDMISKIREMIAEKPEKEKHDDDKNSKKSKATEESKDQSKSGKQHNKLKPKDNIPSGLNEDETAVARSLLNLQKHEVEEVEKAKDAIHEKAQANKRAFEKTKDLLKEMEDGLLKFQNVY